MRRISRDINTAHPHLNEFVMSLGLIGDWHDVNEGIVIKLAAFDTMNGGQTARRAQNQPHSQFPEVDVRIRVSH